MEPIKTIAGKILLYFYSIQRSDYAKLHDLTLEFQMRHFSDPNETSPKLSNKENPIVQDLLKLSGSDNNIYNALGYLRDKGFIEMKRSPDNMSDIFFNFRVSAFGVDIIEGIERGQDEKRQFNVIFNIKVADNINVESLIKAELGSLIKASLL